MSQPGEESRQQQNNDLSSSKHLFKPPLWSIGYLIWGETDEKVYNEKGTVSCSVVTAVVSRAA